MSEVVEESLSLSSLLRPEVRADPYPFYHQLRAEDPVHWDAAMGFWALTRYADVLAALHDTRFGRSEGLKAALNRLPEAERENAAPVYDAYATLMLYADPPYHTTLRGKVSKAFTPRVIERLRPHIQQVVDELLDRVQANGRMEVIAEFARPLPLTVIMELLGLPPEERDGVKRWSDDLFATLGLVRQSPALFATARRSLGEVTDYICAVHDELHARPTEGLLSALVNLSEDEGSLTHQELVMNSLLLLAGGHETTQNLIGNGLLALLRNPEQLQELRREPALIGGAVEELLRYDNPVQIVWRRADADIEIDGKRLQQGQMVNLMLGAANHDPAVFPEPDRLDLRRHESRQLGFGMGMHFCLGAPLARLEGEIALGTLLRRLPDLVLDDAPLVWQEHPSFRGLKSLSVTW
jgi:cytochrome P450